MGTVDTVGGYQQLSTPPQTWAEWAEEMQLFVTEAIRAKEMYAILPTSWTAVQEICSRMFGKYWVETGAGTGRVALWALFNNLIPADGKIVMFEQNPQLFEYLKNKFEGEARVAIYGAFNGDAKDILDDEFKKQQPDSWCSTMGMMHDGDALLKQFMNLTKPGGQVVIGNYLDNTTDPMERMFQSETVKKWVLWNIPWMCVVSGTTPLTPKKALPKKPRRRLVTLV